MLLFTTLHLFLPVVSALPSKSISSILTLNKQSQDELPYGRTPLSKGDMMEIGRMATMINSAYCSNESKLQPHISNSFVNQAKSNRRHYHYQPEHDYHTEGNSIIISSDKPEFVVDRRVGGDMRWYISHTPSTQTLSLVFSSLSTTNDLLELLASTPADNDTLIPLKDSLYPFHHLPVLQEGHQPMLYHAYLNALRSHGNSALKSIIRLIENPPPTIASHKNIIQEYITSLSQPLAAVVNQPIKEVEIIGHGLGSAIGLLVAMGLGLELDMISLPSLRSKVDINVNLFGLPRVGDIHFASLVDEMLRSTSKTRRPKKDHQSTLQINRITSYFDTITHLPERNLGLSHHTNDEYWIGPNPHLGYFCKSNMWSSSDNMKYEDCSNSVKLGKSSLLDHLGPYGGVWIDSECQRD